MKKLIAGITLALSLGSFAFAQEPAKAPAAPGAPAAATAPAATAPAPAATASRVSKTLPALV
ncbi:ammonia channel protein, partial [bacterium]|nr:ammonia channel protein [bacterium]